ncbi:MAG: hypothetical protein H0V76_06970 [Blastocatellia bacterium]|nr:hypothetical protein [Blastocatellia bacterium]
MRTNRIPYQATMIPLFFGSGGVALAGLFVVFRVGNISAFWMTAGFLGLLGLAFGALVAVHYWLMPVGELIESDEIQ